eukprot:365436-Chlamydomonas_euryale.AAC.7
MAHAPVSQGTGRSLDRISKGPAAPPGNRGLQTQGRPKNRGLQGPPDARASKKQGPQGPPDARAFKK